MKLKVVYQDGQVLAVHKPAGMATYGESGASNADHPPPLLGCKEQLEEQLTQRLFPIHRIDSDTEGLVLFALNPKAAAAMIRLFKEQKVKKTYLAWCVGSIQPRGSIRTPLKKHKSELRESAQTDYERLETKMIQSQPFSFVRVSPKTGRFHQIRRHFDSQGHPLVGDPKYGSEAVWMPFFASNEPARLMLFAESVEFMHPVHRRPQKIKIKPGKDWPKSNKI